MRPVEPAWPPLSPPLPVVALCSVGRPPPPPARLAAAGTSHGTEPVAEPGMRSDPNQAPMSTTAHALPTRAPFVTALSRALLPPLSALVRVVFLCPPELVDFFLELQQCLGF